MHCLARDPALALAIGVFCTFVVSLGVGLAQDSGADGYVPNPRAVAGFENRAALTPEREAVEIFSIPNLQVRLPNGRPLIEHAAKRTGGALGVSTAWTTSRDCPALHNVLVWMTALTPPQIEISGVTPSEFDPAGRRPLAISRDGVETRVWGTGTQPDHIMGSGIEMRSNAGHIAEFGRAASASLESCWVPVKPDWLPKELG